MVTKKTVKITNNWNACAGCGTVEIPRYGVEIWHGGAYMGVDEGTDVYCRSCVPGIGWALGPEE